MWPTRVLPVLGKGMFRKKAQSTTSSAVSVPILHPREILCVIHQTSSVYRIRCVSHITRLGRFCKLDCSTTKRVPIANDTSESFRRDVLQRRRFLHRHDINCGDIEHGKSAQRGGERVTHTVVYGYIHDIDRYLVPV